jgi:hypothetical protein
MGRKPIAAEYRRSAKVQVMLTAAEHARLVEASESSGFGTVSEYIRYRLLADPLPKRSGRRPPTGGTGTP